MRGMSQRKAGAAAEDPVVSVKNEPVGAQAPCAHANAKTQIDSSDAMGHAGAFLSAAQSVDAQWSLVPAEGNAQIGPASNQAPALDLRGAATTQNLFKLDEALLDKAFATDVRLSSQWTGQFRWGIHLAITSQPCYSLLFFRYTSDRSRPVPIHISGFANT